MSRDTWSLEPQTDVGRLAAEAGDTPPRAIVAARDADVQPDTTEIESLAAAAGYAVIETVTQRRSEDPTYGLGRGKTETLARLATTTEASTVVYDGALSPGQTFSVGDLLPADVAIIDRPRLVLGHLAAETDARQTALRFELAKLNYELPRLREVVGRESAVRLRSEGDGRVLDLERRRDAVAAELETLESAATVSAGDRAEPRMDRVVVVGYANAGKSRLCRRLAGDDGLYSRVTDRPLETTEAVTATVSLGGRRVRLTDTVGIVGGVASTSASASPSASAAASATPSPPSASPFKQTRDAVADADAAVLVVDASATPETLRGRIRAVAAALELHTAALIPVAHKADRLESAPQADRVTTIADTLKTELATDSPGTVASPVAASAHTGDGIDALAAAVTATLPTATETVRVAYDDGAQTTLSWAYDRGVVADVSYEPDAIAVSLAGRPDVVAAATRRFGEHRL